MGPSPADLASALAPEVSSCNGFSGQLRLAFAYALFQERASAGPDLPGPRAQLTLPGSNVTRAALP
jgi:hypothetical protein